MRRHVRTFSGDASASASAGAEGSASPASAVASASASGGRIVRGGDLRGGFGVGRRRILRGDPPARARLLRSRGARLGIFDETIVMRDAPGGVIRRPEIATRTGLTENRPREGQSVVSG